MKYSRECPFCKKTRFENNKLIGLPAENSILFENDNVYIQVDISPLCLGHILIISNEHYLNFFELPNNIKEDVIKLKNKIKEIYKEVYKIDVLFFEHGSAKIGYAGSSIDHAHLHCIPCDFDIIESLNETLGNATECDILDFSNKFNNEFSYIYVEKNDKKLIYKVEKLPSQFLRKLISEKLNNSVYLWQEKCINEESIAKLKKTILDLKNKIVI